VLHESHVCAGFGESQGNSLAEALGGAGDDRDLIVELELVQYHDRPHFS
jgi:hypothetical protein